MGKSKHMRKSKAAKMSMRKKRGTRKAKTKGGSRQLGGKKKSKKGQKKHYRGHGGMDGATPLEKQRAAMAKQREQYGEIYDRVGAQPQPRATPPPSPPPSPAASAAEEQQQPGYLARVGNIAGTAVGAVGKFIQRLREPAKKPELSEFEKDKLAIMGSDAYQNQKRKAEVFEQHNVPMNAKLYK
jgi:hypothetical protein